MKNSWQTRKLGEVCEVIAGQSPEGRFYNKTGKGLPFYQGKKEFTEKFIGEPTTWTTEITKKARSGDILMSVRAPVGPINFATQKICIGRGLSAIRASKEIDKDFLFNFLKKHENEIVGNAGAVFSSINKTQIENIEIPLPPLPEQCHIVKILDEIFKKTAKSTTNTEKNLQNARELFQSYLQRIFENPKDDWQIKKLGEVCNFYRGLTYKKNNEVGMSKNIVLRANNINLESNSLNFSELKYISDDIEIAENKKVKKNSVLICIASGSKKHLGKIAFIDKNYKYAFGGFMGQLIPNNTIIDSRYFYNVLISDDFRKLLDSLMSGANINNLKFDLIKDFQIPLPPLSEQKRIVGRLDALSEEVKKLEQAYRQKLDNLEELKKSILKQAFSGELAGVQ